MATKLYVVNYNGYDSHYTVGVYDNFEVADRIANIFGSNIDVFELNQGVDKLETERISWYVCKDANSNKVTVNPAIPEMWGITFINYCNPNNGYGNATVVAKNKKEAAKIGLKLIKDRIKELKKSGDWNK